MMGVGVQYSGALSIGPYSLVQMLVEAKTWILAEVVNAIRYVLRTGCAWRMLPHDLPPWRTTFHYFRTWRRDGSLERVHAALRDQVRVAEGRDVSPSAAIIDSQSVKTTEK